MRATQARSVSDTVTVRTPSRSATRYRIRYRVGSYSYAFSDLPDAYQGELCITDSYLPGGVFSKSRGANFEIKGEL